MPPGRSSNRRRHEVASVGFDDYLATLGGEATGLRIPAATYASVEGSAVRLEPYLFLLAVADLVAGDCIVGVEQFLSLCAPQGTPETPPPAGPAAPAAPPPIVPPFYPYERGITDALWHPPDGFAEWILTLDRVPPTSRRSGPFDATPSVSESFAFEDSNSSALLYEAAHFPAVPLAPGYLGLDAYTPPGLKGSSVLTVRDIRFPWGQNQFRALREPVHGNTRARFYCRLQQTTPVGATLGTPRMAMPFALNGTTPEAIAAALAWEDLYLTIFATSAQYFRVAGRIILDKCKRAGG